MPRQWKVLELYSLETIADLVSILLPILDGLTVEEQFRKQSINRVHIRPLLIYGGTYVEYVTKGVQEWIIVLNKYNSLEENIFTLAHELAHTFAYKKNGRIVNVWRTKCVALEDFCDLFATEWLQRNNNREELVQILNGHLQEGSFFFKSPQRTVLSA